MKNKRSKVSKRLSLISSQRPSVSVLGALLSVFVVVGVYFVYRSLAASATLYLSPAAADVGLNTTFDVAVRVNSGSDLVNAVQADLTYPSDKLQFVSIDASTSAFSIQAQNSGGSGIVNIARGTTTPVSGDKLVAIVKFKAIASGSASVNFAGTSAVVRASDNINIVTVKNIGVYDVQDNVAPSAPTGLVAPSKTMTSVNLDWAASTDNVGVTGYKIYRNGAQVGTKTTTDFVDSGLVPNTAYSYRVAAVDAAGNTSAQSAALSVTTLPDTAAPSVPTGLTSPTKTFNSITINWTASTDNVGVTNYKVYRNGVQVGTTTLVFTDTGLTPNTAYSYQVAAVDAVGNTSAKSAAFSVTTLPDTTAPSVPTNLSIAAQTGNSVSLQWSASNDNVGVAGYKIFRNNTQIGTSSSASFTDTSISGGNTYSYKVSAYDSSNNNSAQTGAVTVTIYGRGDINRDGNVDILDLSTLLSNWQRTGTLSSDLNADRVVDILDLSILLSSWDPN